MLRPKPAEPAEGPVSSRWGQRLSHATNRARCRSQTAESETEKKHCQIFVLKHPKCSFVICNHKQLNKTAYKVHAIYFLIVYGLRSGPEKSSVE